MRKIVKEWLGSLEHSSALVGLRLEEAFESRPLTRVRVYGDTGRIGASQDSLGRGVEGSLEELPPCGLRVSARAVVGVRGHDGERLGTVASLARA